MLTIHRVLQRTGGRLASPARVLEAVLPSPTCLILWTALALQRNELVRRSPGIGKAVNLTSVFISDWSTACRRKRDDGERFRRSSTRWPRLIGTVGMPPRGAGGAGRSRSVPELLCADIRMIQSLGPADRVHHRHRSMDGDCTSPAHEQQMHPARPAAQPGFQPDLACCCALGLPLISAACQERLPRNMARLGLGRRSRLTCSVNRSRRGRR